MTESSRTQPGSHSGWQAGSPSHSGQAAQATTSFESRCCGGARARGASPASRTPDRARGSESDGSPVHGQGALMAHWLPQPERDLTAGPGP